MKPSISVLVTVYNREAYLKECLESILSSDFEDFEVIVVDDQSTDGSVEIVKEFAASDSRVHFFQNPSNLGDYPNRNRAAELARGKYLKYVDSDDTIRPDCLAKMVDAMEGFPDAAYCLSYPRPVDLARPALLSPSEAYRCHLIQQQGIFSSAPLLGMIRADCFQEVGGFRPDARNMGDTILWMELSARWPMIIVEDGLTWWRQHEGQEYGLIRDNYEDNAAIHCKLTSLILRDFLDPQSCPLSKRDQSSVRRDCHTTNFRRVAWHLRHGRFKLAGYEVGWELRNLCGLGLDLPEKNPVRK